MRANVNVTYINTGVARAGCRSLGQIGKGGIEHRNAAQLQLHGRDEVLTAGTRLILSWDAHCCR